MLGGAAGGARSRPPSDLQQGASRFPLYSLFPTPGATRPTLHKVTESLFSTSLSTFGVPTPPPNSPYSPLQLEFLNCSQRVLLADKEYNKMDESKLTKCLPDTLCCAGDRQLLDGLGVMQPLTIKTEQAKRSCNTCLTNSPKKVTPVPAVVLTECLPDTLCCAGDRQLLDGLGVMQPLTIKTEQAKRSCNTCLTNSPKKVTPVPAVVLTECLPDTLCCAGDRQLLDGLGVMQPLTIKTEQAKRSCNTCLTNSPKKVTPVPAVVLTECLPDTLCCAGDRQLLDGLGVMQPLTIKTEQAKRSCNTCLTNSPKKVTPVPAVVLTECLPDTLCCAGDRQLLDGLGVMQPLTIKTEQAKRSCNTCLTNSPKKVTPVPAVVLTECLPDTLCCAGDRQLLDGLGVMQPLTIKTEQAKRSCNTCLTNSPKKVTPVPAVVLTECLPDTLCCAGDRQLLDGLGVMQPLTIKTEQAKRSCNTCLTNSPKKVTPVPAVVLTECLPDTLCCAGDRQLLDGLGVMQPLTIKTEQAKRSCNTCLTNSPKKVTPVPAVVLTECLPDTLCCAGDRQLLDGLGVMQPLTIKTEQAKRSCNTCLTNSPKKVTPVPAVVLTECLPDTLCCAGDRQLLDGLGVMQPLTIKTEQAKRSCNTCLTNSPKKVTPVPAVVLTECLPDTLCCAGDRQLLDGLGVMQPLTIKTEQAKRSCNTCLTNSPKKVTPVPAVVLTECLPDTLCCAGDRQLLDGLGVMQPLTIKTEQAKRSCNTCLTNSPKKVTPVPAVVLTECLPDTLCCAGDRQLLDGLGVMQPLTIKTEQAKRSCNTCLTNSPKKVTPVPAVVLTECLPDTLCCAGDRQLLDGLGVMQPLTIKTEQAKRSCNTCLTNSPKKVIHTDGGCSRTNPVTWLGVAGQNVQVQVKREPQQMHMSELVAVKLEQASPGNKDHGSHGLPSSLNNGSIPVGIAVARQRVGDAGLLAALSQKDNQQRLHEIEQAAMTVGVANVLCDDRPAPLAWPAPPAPPPPAPMWQYPAAQVSMESMVMGGVGGVGMGSVGGGVPSVGGFQLVREPTSGALILLPTPPDLQHAVVWGGVPYSSAPLILPPAPHPPHHLQLLSGDLLASSATLQHTHTHSTRLVTLAPAPPPQTHPAHTADKRKPMMQPLMNPHALIKIEPEPPQEKPQPTYAPEPIQQPLLATHLYYQPDYSDQACRSQATSPAAPPTPPPEAPEGPAHKDASNQTDHIDDDDDSPNHADEDERDVACVGVAHFPDDSTMVHAQTQMLHPPSIDSAEDSSSEGLATSAVVGAVEKAIDAIERDDTMDNCSSGGSHDLVIDTANTSPVPTSMSNRPPVDVSGLELLSNSIEQFERTTPGTCMPTLEPTPLTVDVRTSTKLNLLNLKTSPKSSPRTEAESHARFEFPPAEPSTSDGAKPSLDGLGLLCALAEQRFMEEVENPPPTLATSRPFIKSELLSPTEIDRSAELKKERHRHRDGDSSSERKRRRSRDRAERLRHKLEKMRRHKRERDQDEGRGSGGELEASLRRVTACSCGSDTCSHSPAVPSAHDLVNAIEKDMRERLQDLQRQCDEKRAQLNALTPPLPALSTPPTPSTPALSPDSDRGSSKKRKVGRPRKVSSPDLTETIVAKKPKSKSSLVGYLLAKGKLKGGILCTRGEPSREDTNRTSKVRPKLKAEPILKVCSEEEETGEWGLNRSASSSMESLNEVRQKNREKVDKLVRKHSRDDLPELEFAIRRASASSDSDKERRRAKKRRKSVKSKERSSDDVTVPKPEPVVPVTSMCTLTEDKLDNSPRVLTAMGGLFYAGKLSAVTAPDVYAITLDGERGNKPHILSREETLRDAILEVSPSSVAELPPGTRVCAYWSQQYRCLYPGTVAESSPDPHDDKFVAVEFDDGDSGRIAIEDIRFLEPNYPVVEYENPLFTLGKRRRNTSVTEEKKTVAPIIIEPKPSTSEPKTEDDRHKDRKKLKKHRKDKIKRHSSEDDPNSVDYVKKKKKKHKCCEEHCKHRKHHKKHHRKHRKRHHSDSKEQSSSSGDERRQKSSSDYIDSNKSNEDSGDSNDRLSTLIAVEKSPDDKMKTVIKKAVLSKKALVKNAVLDFSNLAKVVLKTEEVKDNLKDSGICLDEEPASTSDVSKKKSKKRTVSSTSSDGGGGAGVSKMAAFLPGGALWRWRGAAYRRTARPRHKKLFYRAIQRGEEILNVGEAAVFLSTGRADRPYIGRIVALWEARGAMAVRVKWFYHPEETASCPDKLHYPGGLFESPHTDENDVQTISHKCEVLPLAAYKERMGDDAARYSSVYDNNDVYYLAGHYDPTQRALRMEPDIPFLKPTST